LCESDGAWRTGFHAQAHAVVIGKCRGIALPRKRSSRRAFLSSVTSTANPVGSTACAWFRKKTPRPLGVCVRCSHVARARDRAPPRAPLRAVSSCQIHTPTHLLPRAFVPPLSPPSPPRRTSRLSRLCAPSSTRRLPRWKKLWRRENGFANVDFRPRAWEQASPRFSSVWMPWTRQSSRWSTRKCTT